MHGAMSTWFSKKILPRLFTTVLWEFTQPRKNLFAEPCGCGTPRSPPIFLRKKALGIGRRSPAGCGSVMAKTNLSRPLPPRPSMWFRNGEEASPISATGKRSISLPFHAIIRAALLLYKGTAIFVGSLSIAGKDPFRCDTG